MQFISFNDELLMYVFGKNPMLSGKSITVTVHSMYYICHYET